MAKRSIRQITKAMDAARQAGDEGEVQRLLDSLPQVAKDRAGDKLMDEIDKAEPKVIPSLLAGKIFAGTIEATCFSLVNEKSERIAALTTTKDDEPGIAFFRPGSDRSALEIALYKHGPEVRLNDEQGRPRLTLALSTEDTREPRVCFFTERGYLPMTLMLKDDRPMLEMFPRKGKARHLTASNIPQPEKSWAAAMRAVERNQRTAFNRHVLDCGFYADKLDAIWKEARSRMGQRKGGK